MPVSEEEFVWLCEDTGFTGLPIEAGHIFGDGESLIIGGMPECVASWIRYKDPTKVSQIQREWIIGQSF